MPHEKFDVAHLERLNDRSRLDDTPPAILWEALGNPSPDTIVEIGAGTGLFACSFADLAPTATVYAADIEPSAVRWMIEHRAPSMCARLKPILSRETAVPLPTGEADIVAMINLHHELMDPVESYREALRIARIGGQLLVVDWAPDSSELGPPQHVRSTAEQIAEVARTVGFDDIAIHPGLRHHSVVTARKPVICSL